MIREYTIEYDNAWGFEMFVDTDVFTQEKAKECLELTGSYYRRDADLIDEFMEVCGIRAVEVSVEFHWNCREFLTRMSAKEGMPSFNGGEGILINHLPPRYEFDKRLIHVNHEEIDEMPTILF